MVLKVIGRFVSSILSVMLSWVWAVQCSGVVAALVPELNEVSTTTLMIQGITIGLSVVAVVLIWSGVMAFSNLKRLKVTNAVISLYFISLIGLTVGYMALLGEVKYVLLFEVICAWVIWFVIMTSISNIRKNIKKSMEVEETVAGTDAEVVEEPVQLEGSKSIKTE